MDRKNGRTDKGTTCTRAVISHNIPNSTFSIIYTNITNVYVKYNDKQKFVNLTRLDKKRVSSGLVETFKMMNGFHNLNKDLVFGLEVFDSDKGGHRGHDKK